RHGRLLASRELVDSDQRVARAERDQDARQRWVHRDDAPRGRICCSMCRQKERADDRERATHVAQGSLPRGLRGNTIAWISRKRPEGARSEAASSPPRQPDRLEYPASAREASARSEAEPSEVNRSAPAQQPQSAE